MTCPCFGVARDLIAQASEDSILAGPVYDAIRDQRIVRVRAEVATPIGIVVDTVAHGPVRLAALTRMPWLFCAPKCASTSTPRAHFALLCVRFGSTLLKALFR